MIFQLGDKEFQGTFAPSAWSYSGNEANFAEQAIINGKPLLQLTGQKLEQIDLSLKLRAEFCNPANEIKDFEKWKNNGEVLSLLFGNGEYKGDYVVKAVGKNIMQTFADGTIIEVEVTLSLLEYVPKSKDAQQAATDRKNATAVGDKNQISRNPSQPKTAEADAHAALMAAQIHSWNAAETANAALNTGQPQNFVQKIHKSIFEAQQKMDMAQQKMYGVQTTVTGATSIISAIQQTITQLSALQNLTTPPVSLNNLNYGIIDLHTSLKQVDYNSTSFTQYIILRIL